MAQIARRMMIAALFHNLRHSSVSITSVRIVLLEGVLVIRVAAKVIIVTVPLARLLMRIVLITLTAMESISVPATKAIAKPVVLMTQVTLVTMTTTAALDIYVPQMVAALHAGIKVTVVVILHTAALD